MYGYGMMEGWGGGFGLFGLVTWLLLIVFLVLGIMYFWKGLNGKRK